METTKVCVIWRFSSVVDEDQSLREYGVSTGSYRRFGCVCCFRFNGISPFLGLTKRVNLSIQITEVDWRCLVRAEGSVMACNVFISWARALHCGLCSQCPENRTLWKSWPLVFDGVPIVSWVEWGCHVCRPCSGTSLFISCNTTRWPWLGDDALLFISRLHESSYL